MLLLLQCGMEGARQHFEACSVQERDSTPLRSMPPAQATQMSATPTTPTASAVLASPREERFCQIMALGELAAWEAYSQIRPRLEESTWRTEGPNLLRKHHIRERISAIQLASATRTSMTVEEWRQFQEDVIRTPIADVNEHHPLAQEVTYIMLAGKRPRKGEEAEPDREMVKVKMPSKLEAIKTLGGHHGWNGKQEVEIHAADSLATVLAQIRQPGIPKVPAEALAEELAKVPEVPVVGFLGGGNVPAAPPP